MNLKKNEGINILSDEMWVKIFQYLTEKYVCRISRVCKRFDRIVEHSSLWQFLYQKVYKYDLPLFIITSNLLKFKFVSPEEFEYENLWKKSFIQLYQGVHVRLDFENSTIKDHTVKCFNTIHGALSYVKNNKKDPPSQNLIFVHSGTHNLNDTIIIESNVALIGAASGSKHEIAKKVIINSDKNIMYMEHNLKHVYVGCITLQLSLVKSNYLTHCLLIHSENTPVIDCCIFRSSNIKSAAVFVSGNKSNPLIKKCDISNCSNIGLYVTKEAQGIYKDNTISYNANAGIFVDCACPIIRRNKIHHNRSAGIYIFNNGSGCFENNEIYHNKIGFQITSSMPIIRRNSIFNNYSNGVDISKSNGLFEENIICNNAIYGMDIIMSYVTVRHNKIYHNRDGIYVQMRSKGVIEKNKVYNNSFTNVSIITDSMLTIKKNKIYGQQIGVYFDGSDRGTLEENIILNHLHSGVKVSNCSNLEIRKNKIKCNERGVLVSSNSFDVIQQNYKLEKITNSCWIEDNEINHNMLTGIEIISKSNVTVRYNKIYCNNRGIVIQRKSTGQIEENEIYDNFSSNVLVTTDSKPILKRNQIHSNLIGVHFNFAHGKLEENDIYDHTRSGIKISNYSNPKILSNRIWNNQEGVLVCDNSLGFLKQNYIFNSTTDNVKIINSKPILKYNQVFGGQGHGINMQENSGIFKQNYIFRNTDLGVLISARSQPRLIRNMIFCNGITTGVEITEVATATLRLNARFHNGQNNLQIENE